MSMFGSKNDPAAKDAEQFGTDHAEAASDHAADLSVESIVVSESHNSPILPAEDVYIPPADFDGDTFESLGVDHDAHAMSESRRLEIVQEVGERPSSLPIIGNMPIRSQYALSIGALVGSLILVAGFAGYGFVSSAKNQTRAATGTNLEMLTQRILASAQYAVRGEKTGAERLVESRAQAGEQLINLEEGRNGVSQMSMDSNANLSSVNMVMKTDIFPVVDKLIALAPSLSLLQKNNADLEAAMSTIFINSEQLISIFQSNGSSPIYGAAAEHIRVLAERVRRNGSSLLTSSDIRIETLSEYVADVQNLRKTIDSLVKGDPSVGLSPVTDPQSIAILKSLNENSTSLYRVAKFIEENAQGIVTARRSLSSLVSSTETGLKSAGDFSKDMQVKSTNAFTLVYVSILFVLGALGALVLLGLVNSRSARIEAWEGAFQNKKNEKDIIDFMEAILPLEMGDLTARFNSDMGAMEGITGSIRSSVNEAVISLHDAVNTVQTTADGVTDVVTSSVRSSFQMQESNERQATEIDDVVNRVATLTDAISSVTEKTIAAADVTTAARSASTEGVEVVTKTNEKMAQIRANMQDVLKSVKHLGETSHEIGTIVEAIESITDRTQVLAVNASLEAAKAGAAGQGFQIIAGEVNRLSEQSNEALKTITALVQRIQGETGLTIKTVEESTNNVVEGAKLSEIATDKLSTIERLSSELFGLMTEIRSQSESQTTNASEVTQSMDRLAVLSKEFQTSVAEVVAGVQEIDVSMGTLKNTVQTFNTDEQLVGA